MTDILLDLDIDPSTDEFWIAVNTLVILNKKGHTEEQNTEAMIQYLVGYYTITLKRWFWTEDLWDAGLP